MSTDTLSNRETESRATHAAPSPTPWRQVWPGVLFLLVVGSVYLIIEAPREWVDLEIRSSIGGPLFLGSYLVILLGALAGWLAGFPRWSYPYLTYSLIFAAYISSASTPGIEIFGVPVWGREVWGLRACVPIALVFIVGLLLTRNQPIFPVTLIDSLTRDWTQAAFSFYGLLPLVLLISGDEVDNWFFFPAAVAAFLLAAAGSFVYLRAASRPMALTGLFAGAFTSVYTVNVVSRLYWAMYEIDTTTLERWRSTEPIQLGDVILRPIFGALFVCGIMVGLLLFGKLIAGSAQAVQKETE